MSRHYLDWEIKPPPFKTYKNLRSIPLPHIFPDPKEPALEAIRGGDTQLSKKVEIGLDDLAELLFYSAGLTRRMKIGTEDYYMRAASATGALYPIELYVVSSRVSGLDPGIYHFNPLTFGLVQLREGDLGSLLSAASAGGTAHPPLTIVFTSTAWRNAWKYEARSYRHWFWDAGVIAANLLATGVAERIPTRFVMGFIDEEVDKLLGLPPEKEATVALVEFGNHSETSRDESSSIGQIHNTTDQPSEGEVSYPIIWELNRASSLHSPSEVEEWRRRLHPNPGRETKVDRLFPLKRATTDSPALGEVILRRGSTRRFAQKSIGFQALSSIIESSSGHIPLDFLSHNDSLIEPYLIANHVEELPGGSYHYNRESRSLEQLKEGKMRYVSGYLCLEQPLFSDASVVFFLMTDLRHALDDLGDRGYRAAQFEAGIRAGQIYLSAYGLGIGASGSTFYDDAVTEFFSPHAKDLSTMIAVGVGVPAYKARPGKILPQFAVKRSAGL